MMSTFISVGELVELQRSDKPVRLLDVRWSLAETNGRPAYEAGHLPGAVYVDLETELSQHGDPSQGRHPLPSEEGFQASVRRWGVNTDDTVVVYDAGNSLAAARAWWLLRFAGVSDVRILDGGLAAWTATGQQVSTEVPQPEPGDFVVSFGHQPVITIDEASEFTDKGGLLLDARAGERYRGESEPVDPQAGHIPGAINAPTADNVHADGTFLTHDELTERFTQLGITADQPVAVYCGSGVTAAHEIAALESIGITAALYPGSWSAWSNTPGRPVATGADPGGKES